MSCPYECKHYLPIKDESDKENDDLGSWEIMYDGEVRGGVTWVKCSKCELIITVTMSQGYNYCPRCGQVKV